MTTRPIAADQIADLTRPFTTTELVTQPVRGTDQRWRTTTSRHTVTHPGLLHQIRNTVTTSSNAGDLHHAAYGSKPAGRIDALAFLERINHESSAMSAAYLLPTRTLEPRLRALAGLIGNHPDTRVTAWWTTARILTQHDGPPYSPDVPCPNEGCDHRGSLRVRVDDRIGVCVECQDTWSDDADDPTRTFGRLAMWVRWAFIHLHGPHHLIQADGETTQCPECAPERAAAARRAVSRRSAPRRARTGPQKPAQDVVALTSPAPRPDTGAIGTAMPDRGPQ